MQCLCTRDVSEYDDLLLDLHLIQYNGVVESNMIRRQLSRTHRRSVEGRLIRDTDIYDISAYASVVGLP